MSDTSKTLEALKEAHRGLTIWDGAVCLSWDGTWDTAKTVREAAAKLVSAAISDLESSVVAEPSAPLVEKRTWPVEKYLIDPATHTVVPLDPTDWMLAAGASALSAHGLAEAYRVMLGASHMHPAMYAESPLIVGGSPLSEEERRRIVPVLHLGACLTDGKLHATVMTQEANGYITVVATAEMDEATLRARDCHAIMERP